MVYFKPFVLISPNSLHTLYGPLFDSVVSKALSQKKKKKKKKKEVTTSKHSWVVLSILTMPSNSCLFSWYFIPTRKSERLFSVFVCLIGRGSVSRLNLLLVCITFIWENRCPPHNILYTVSLSSSSTINCHSVWCVSLA